MGALLLDWKMFHPVAWSCQIINLILFSYFYSSVFFLFIEEIRSSNKITEYHRKEKKKKEERKKKRKTQAGKTWRVIIGPRSQANNSIFSLPFSFPPSLVLSQNSKPATIRGRIVYARTRCAKWKSIDGSACSTYAVGHFGFRIGIGKRIHTPGPRTPRGFR